MTQKWKCAGLCCLAAVSFAGSPPAGEAVTAAAFAAKAYAALPVEEPYAFHKELTKGIQRVRRDPNAVPAPGEMAVPSRGWSLAVRADANPVLRRAAEEFRDYLASAMQTAVTLTPKDSLADWAQMRNAIIAGTRAELPGCGGSLKSRKDYQVVVSPERIAVCGFD